MKLTAKSEYALLALAYLAGQGKGEYVPVDSIAEAQGIPAEFLEQILLTLKRAGYLGSQKGHHGGYRLAKDADRITLAEVIRLLDGALAPSGSVSRYFYEPTPIQKHKALVAVFREIRDFISDKLEGTTLADIA
jgi:Rrf2 family transcriptional regulator, cysteine metabolism repressor